MYYSPFDSKLYMERKWIIKIIEGKIVEPPMHNLLEVVPEHNIARMLSLYTNQTVMLKAEYNKAENGKPAAFTYQVVDDSWVFSILGCVSYGVVQGGKWLKGVVVDHSWWGRNEVQSSTAAIGSGNA
jgi:hypothetical protein